MIIDGSPLVLSIPQKLVPIFSERRRIKAVHGGRNGFKSWTVADYLLSRGMNAKERILCTREVQKSIEQSVHQLLKFKIEQRNLPYIVTKNRIYCPFTETEFIFHGLRDDTAKSIKSLEGITICWVEEAQFVSKESLDILIPTVRLPGSEIIFTFNRFEEIDPVYGRYCLNDDPNVLNIEINFDDCLELVSNEILAEAEKCRLENPEEFLHIWKGQPLGQGENKALKITDVKAAMERKVKDVGGIEMGVDVARFGDDRTVISKRKGLKFLGYRIYKGLRTYEVAHKAIEFARDGLTSQFENEDQRQKDLDRQLAQIKFKVDDTGVGGGVTDELYRKGMKAVPVNNNGTAKNEDKYADAITEMYFEFQDSLPEIELNYDTDALQELTGRKYGYDKRDRKKVESKKEYKDRMKRSPDIADSILLCFYNCQRGLNVGVI